MTSLSLTRRLASLALGVFIACGFGASAAQAKWMRAETAHFVLYSDGSEAGLRGYAADLEDFDALLRAMHGMDANAAPARKLEIYLVAGNKDLAKVLPTVSERVAGIYRANLGDIYAVAIRGERGSDDGQRFLFHEYVHHFMLQNYAAAYPAWLMEGYAEYFGSTLIEDRQIEVGVAPLGRTRNLTQLPWLPLDQVVGLRPPTGAGRDGRGVGAMYYAESWLLTHYMLSDPARRAHLADYTVAVAGGADPVASMEAALGMSLASAEPVLKKYLQSSPGIRYARPGRPAIDVAVTTLPPSADALLLEAQRLKSGVPAADRPAFLQLIRDRAASFPDDRLAMLTLARAEITFGDRAAGEAILARRLAAEPRDVDALWLMALGRLFAGNADRAHRADLYAEAGPWLGKAFALDPNRYQILFDFAQSRSLTPDYPSDNTLTVLLRAVQLAPQVAPVRLGAARALMKRARFDQAIILLTPLANSPHGGGPAEAAQRLIAQARAGQAAAQPVDEDEDGPDDR